MSRVFVNTSDHLDVASVSVSDTPLTLSAWTRAPASNNHKIVTLGESGTGNNWISIGANTSAPKSPYAAEKDTSEQTVNSLQGGNSGDRWHLITGVFTSHSSRAIFIDGTGKNTNSSVKTAAGWNAVKISGDTAASPAAPINGKIAHIAIWNIALSDAQVYSLLYLYPNQVAVGNLVNYWPLTGNQSPEPDYGSGNLPLTVTGTTFSTDNPNIAGTAVQQLMGAIG